MLANDVLLGMYPAIFVLEALRIVRNPMPQIPPSRSIVSVFLGQVLMPECVLPPLPLSGVYYSSSPT
jgi:hypothetical protein